MFQAVLMAMVDAAGRGGAPRVNATKPKWVCLAIEKTQRPTHRGRREPPKNVLISYSPNHHSINFIDPKRQECPSSDSPDSSPSMWIVFLVNLRNVSQVMQVFFLVLITPLYKFGIIWQCSKHYDNQDSKNLDKAI